MIENLRIWSISGVPAGQFGLEQVVEIGPMSGKSNVIYWLEKRGIEANDDRVNRIYDRAKASVGGAGRRRNHAAGLSREAKARERGKG